MDQMRFGRPEHRPENREVAPSHFRDEPKYEEPRGSDKSGKFKPILFWFLGILVLLASIFGAWRFYESKQTFKLNDPNASPYYAVFLVNGQVYFGRPLRETRKEFVLTDVYYLQLSGKAGELAAGPEGEQRFALVKLGQEVHGPTDVLFINRQNILFYEQLSKESKVVESINAN